MADLEKQFQDAADAIKNLKTRPTDEELLELYGLFKQATVGDNELPKPGMFAMKERAKHDFWLRKKGMSKDDAKKAYIEKSKILVNALG